MPTVDAHISRTSLSLPSLALEDRGTYRIVSVDVGGVSWRRQEATSPYQHGSFQVGAVKDLQTGSLAVRAYGSSPSELESNVDALLRAFDQFTYHLDVIIDGEEHDWQCDCADYEMNDGQGFDKFAQNAKQQTWVFKFPRQPIPLIGAY